MTAWLVTGIDAPDWVGDVLANARRQTVHDLRLVAVRNGAGLDVDPGQLLDAGAIVVESEHGCAEYVNAGIAEVRKRAAPADLFLKFDSDDYYGPRYVERALAAAAPGVVAGQTSFFVRTTDCELWSVVWSHGGIGDTHGPTLGCLVRDLLGFPRSPSDWGEDGLWLRAMLASGVEFRAVPQGHFAYCRHADRRHAFPVADESLRHLWPGAVVESLGPWDERIVNGELAPARRDPIPFDPRRLADVGEALLRDNAARSGVV
jgi:hypothetical protein